MSAIAALLSQGLIALELTDGPVNGDIFFNSLGETEIRPFDCCVHCCDGQLLYPLHTSGRPISLSWNITNFLIFFPLIAQI